MGSKISEPKTTFNIETPQLAAGITPHKVLLVSQGLGANFTNGALVSNMINESTVKTLAGARSAFFNAYLAFRDINPITQVDGIILADNGAGSAAAGAIVAAGTATETKDIDIVVASEDRHTVTITVAKDDTATIIGDKIVAAMTADESMPATGVNTAGSVAVTAANKGTVGNFGLKVIGSVAGVTFTITAMSGGAGNPVTTATLDAVAGARYQTVIWDESLDITVLSDWLKSRYNVENDVLNGVGIVTKTDTFSNIGTLLDTLNDQSLVVLCREVNSESNSEYVLEGGDILEWNPMHSAQFAAVRSYRLTDGANIISLLTGATGRDSRGGAALGSRPYFNTPFDNMDLAPIGVGFEDIEIEQLKEKGGSVIGNNRARTGVISGEIVTTYKTDAAGNDDPSYEFLNTVDTVSLIREYFWNNFKVRFAQTRLTTGDLVEGRPMANEGTVRSFCARLFTELAGSDYALTQAGSAALKAFKQNLDVTIDVAKGLVIVEANVVPIVGQYRETFGKIKFAFNINAA